MRLFVQRAPLKKSCKRIWEISEHFEILDYLEICEYWEIKEVWKFTWYLKMLRNFEILRIKKNAQKSGNTGKSKDILKSGNTEKFRSTFEIGENW